MQRVTVVKVNGLNKPEQRKDVCYVGREFAGWPGSIWGNYPFKAVPVGYRNYLLTLPPNELEDLLAKLWVACDYGAKPLGCWCLNWNGIGDAPACHAAVWAEMLNKKHFP